MHIFYLQLQSNRHICPYTSIVDKKNVLSTIEIVEVVEVIVEVVEVIVEVMGVVEVIEVSLLSVEVTSLQKSKSLRVVPQCFFQPLNSKR